MNEFYVPANVLPSRPYEIAKESVGGLVIAASCRDLFPRAAGRVNEETQTFGRFTSGLWSVRPERLLPGNKSGHPLRQPASGDILVARPIINGHPDQDVGFDINLASLRGKALAVFGLRCMPELDLSNEGSIEFRNPEAREHITDLRTLTNTPELR